MLRVVLLTFVVTVSGCSDHSKALKPSPTAQPSSPIQRMEKKSQVHKFEGYVFELPVRFKLTENGEVSLPRDMKMVSFAASQGGGDTKIPQETFVMIRIPDEKVIAEVRKNPRQAIVNFSAGFSDSQGLKII
ncbi:MAG: hypothetical protein FJ308_07865, partial [Planctomycetes bacterium]|nr:hypothetical protein [Planctomycetota bacterium]